MVQRVYLAIAFLGSTAFATGCIGQGQAASKGNGRTRSAALTAVPRTAASSPSTPLVLSSQHDPGPRAGAAGAGGAFAGDPTIPGSTGLNSFEIAFFNSARDRFQEVDSVDGSIESGVGLGPAFNGNGCAVCHSQPTIGGTSPSPTSPQVPQPNPQVALATLHHTNGNNNFVPSFISADGPVREARFIANPDGSQDGGVHDLFTITGRSDAPPGCNLAQPDFATQIANFNISFRIPTALFGLGLVEAVTEDALRSNLQNNASAKANLGIGGHFNTNGNDGTITRFGWKAQNKTLLMFAGEAYNVEQGVTNELFANERADGGCAKNNTPEDSTNITINPNNTTTGTASQMSADVVNFAAFMRLSAPAQPAQSTASTKNGASLFNSVGCALCHTPTLTTGPSTFTGMSGFNFHPYSDFAVHHMGSTLADGITQGGAGPDEFRTAPLWGIGQRLFFLHDGRTSDLLQAIEAHFSSGADCVENYVESDFVASGFSYTLISDHSFCGSEANAVVDNFNALGASQQQDVLSFLRSL